MPKFKPENKNDDELTEIQKYLMEQHSDKTETAETKPIKTTTPTPDPISIPPVAEETNVDDILDTAMLQSLIDTLGEEQFLNLLDGFLDKSAEIIENMNTIIEENNIPSLGTRAHELKGMSGNFGMKQVSAIAGEVEKSAKMAQKENALSEARKLNAANDRTKAAFQKWIENLKA